MANIYGRQFSLTMQPGVVTLFMRAAIGAAGAPTITVNKSYGIRSIARVSAGLYTVTLGNSSATQKYISLLQVTAVFLNATAPAAPLYFIPLDSINSAGSFRIQFTNLSQVATDPGSGEILKLVIDLSNSTAP